MSFAFSTSQKVNFYIIIYKKLQKKDDFWNSRNKSTNPKKNNMSLLIPNNSFNYNSNRGEKVQRQLNFLSKTITPESIPDSGIMNRPTITFKPQMELYNLKAKDLLNPSKLNYIVSVTPPPCHLRKNNSKTFEIRNRSNFNNNNFFNRGNKLY